MGRLLKFIRLLLLTIFAISVSAAAPATARVASLPTPVHHEYDDDGCCVHCNFDGAEAAHLRSCTHPDDRAPRAEYEVFCAKRKNIEPTPYDKRYERY